MSCTTTQSTEQVLEAMNYYFGERHCRSITFTDDTAGSVSGDYFDLNLIDEDYKEVPHYVLLSNGSAVDPAPVGKTKIEVTFADDDTAATIAGLFITAVNALSGVNAVQNGAVVEVENRFLGLITEEVYTNAPSVTGVINTAGFGGELGAVSAGGSTMTTEQTLVDITSDQSGALLLDQIVTGGAVAISIPLVEMTTANWERLVGKVYGSIYDASGTNLVGYGEDKLYQSAFNLGGMLIAHPIRKSMSDRSADIVFWKTAPTMDDISYSGQDVQVANFTFSALVDRSKPVEINQMARGDASLV